MACSGVVEFILRVYNDILVTDSNTDPSTKLFDSDTPLSFLQPALLQTGLYNGKPLPVRLHCGLLSCVHILYYNLWALQGFAKPVYMVFSSGCYVLKDALNLIQLFLHLP